MAFAKGYWHWFFLIQPEPVPETMIGANPEYWLKNHMGRHAGTGIFSPDRWSEYLSGASNPQSMHAMCEDYRAGASIEMQHDREDNGKMVACPLMTLWASYAPMGRIYDVLATWKERASNVTGKQIPGGHNLPDTSPKEVIAELRAFFKA